MLLCIYGRLFGLCSAARVSLVLSAVQPGRCSHHTGTANSTAGLHEPRATNRTPATRAPIKHWTRTLRTQPSAAYERPNIQQKHGSCRSQNGELPGVHTQRKSRRRGVAPAPRTPRHCSARHNRTVERPSRSAIEGKVCCRAAGLHKSLYSTDVSYRILITRCCLFHWFC